MANNANFNLNIKTKVDSAELNKLKQQLQEIRNLATDVEYTGVLTPKEIDMMTAAARNLEHALDAAFDVELNTVNIQKFNQYLNQTGLNIKDLQADLALAGAAGQQAFVNITSNVLKMGNAIKHTSAFLDKMATTMANTIRWSITSSILNTITGSIQKAYYYVEDLDTGLNDIRIVTGKSADEMARFAEEANNAAKALAVSTTDYTEGALIYYQQGLDDETVKTLTDITAKTSNVTGQSMQAVSEQLTAVWNGYQVANEAAREGMQVYEEYVDKMAAVGAATASDLEELATAMSKVASAANAMGVDFDQLSAQIATIVSVTRQAPESVGTALKTIYARIGDLKIEGVDEFGVSLGDVSSQLAQVGIQVMDQSGNLRDVGIVMEEVAGKWNTWNEAQQQSVAIALAGKRQYNNLLALFENWDMYTDTLETAQNAAGTLDKQQNIALDSLENKLEQLTATAEDLYDSLFDEEGLKDLIDGVIPLVQGLANMADAIGGLNTLLPALGSIGVKVFSNQIATGIARMRDNIVAAKNETITYSQALKEVQNLFPDYDFVTGTGDNAMALSAGVKSMVEYYKELVVLKDHMNQQDLDSFNNIINSKAEVANLNIQLEEEIENWKQLNLATKFNVVDKATGNIDYTKLSRSMGVYSSSAQTLNNDLTKLTETAQGFRTKGVTNAIDKFFASVGTKGNYINNAELQKFKGNLEGIIQAATKDGHIDKGTLGKIKKLISEYPGASQEILKLVGALDRLEEGAEKSGEAFKKHMKFKQTINTISNTIGAIGQLASAWNTLSQLDDIWNNETLSDGEKLTQILMNLGFVLPMVGTALGNLNTTFKFTTVISKAWTAMTGPAAAGTGLWTKAQLGLNAAMSANPVGAIVLAITALIAIIGLAVSAYNEWNVTAEEASEQLVASVEKYNETKTELQDLETELENCTNRLKELHAIADEDLTVADKQEIATLEAQNAALEAQIELKKQQLALEQREIINKGNQAIEKGSFNITTGTLVNEDGQHSLGAGAWNALRYWAADQGLTNLESNSFDQAIAVADPELYNKLITDVDLALQQTPNNGLVSFGAEGGEFGVDILKNLKEQWIHAREEYMDQLTEDYEAAMDTLPAYYAQNVGGVYNSQISALETSIKNYYKSTGALGSISEKILNNVFSSQGELDAILNSALNKKEGKFKQDAFIKTLNDMGANGEEVFKILQTSAQTLGLSIYDLLMAADEYDIKIFTIKEDTEDTAKSTEELNKIYDEQFDRFWKLTKQIDILSDALSDLNELQSHLHGQELINNLEKENELLDDQATYYNQLAEAQMAAANEYAKELRKYGVEFTEEGYISNYEDVTRTMSLKKGSKDYDKFMHYLEAYEDLRYKQMVDRANEQNRIYYEKLANNLQAWETEIQMKLDTKELDRAWNDFIKTMEEDFKSIYTDFDNEFENFTSNMNSYTKGINSTLQVDMGAAQRVINEMKELQKAAADANEADNGDIFVSLTEGKEKLKELYQQLMDDAESAKQLWQDAWDTYLDAIDEAAERTGDLSNEFDRINDNLEYQRELTELIYGPEAYSIQREIYQAQLGNSLEQVDFARQQVEIWQQYYDSAEEGSEEQLKYYELLTEAQDKLNESILSHIQIIKNDYANAINEALADIDVALGGDFGLEGMREEWDRAIEEEDKYYNGLERIYQLTTLQNKYQNAINKTADTKYQASIKKMMEDQLSTLRDKEKLTEYDIELAEKRLIIAEKQAALEDARNAKNAMKLVRGADGNWSYQYVADIEGVEEKQQELMDSYNDLYEFSQEAQRESVEAFLKAKEEYYAEMQKIASNEKLTEDEKLQAFNDLHNQYFNAETGILTILQKEYEDKTKEFSRITSETLIGYYQADEDAFDKMTDNERAYIEGFLGDLKDITYPELYKAIQAQYEADESAMKEYTDANSLTWNTAANQMADKWNGTDEKSVASQLQAAYQKIADATEAYSEAITKLKEKAGKDFTNISGSVGLSTSATEEFRKKVQEVIDLIGTPEDGTGLSAFKKKVDEIAGSWEQAYKNVQTMINKIKEALGMETGELFAGNNKMPGPLDEEESDSENSGEVQGNESYGAYQSFDDISIYRRGLNGNVDWGDGLKFTAGRTLTVIDKNDDGTYSVSYQDNYGGSHTGVISQSTFDKLYRAGTYSASSKQNNNIVTEETTNNASNVTTNNSNNSFSIDWAAIGDWWLKHGGQMIAGEFIPFDTGGYTGEWDSSGRLAMLHQKELVLNASDTVNMLETVKAVRDIAATVGSAIKGNVYSMLVEKIGGIAAGAPWARESNDNAQPNVFNITAEFPNANSVAEIQEAILSLPNLASQYLAENRR